VEYLPLCAQVQVDVDLTALPHTQCCCPRGSSRTNFQVLVLVFVPKSQVLDNNNGYPDLHFSPKNSGQLRIRCKFAATLLYFIDFLRQCKRPISLAKTAPKSKQDGALDAFALFLPARVFARATCTPVCPSCADIQSKRRKLAS